MRAAVIIAYLCTWIQGFTQLPDYHVQLLDENYGIRTYDIRDIVKDQYNFLWLLHNYSDRIQRFDGKRIREFKLEGYQSSLLCDRSNRVWTTSAKQVFRYENEHRGFVKISVDTTGQPLIGSVFQLPGRPVWLETNKGIFFFDSLRNNFRKLIEGKYSNPVNVVRGVTRAYENTLFFAVFDSLYALNTLTGVQKALHLSGVYGIYPFSNSLVLLTTRKGQSLWYDFANKTITPVNISSHVENLSNNFFTVNDVLQTDSNYYLITTSDKGLFEFNNQTGRFRKLVLFFRGKPLLEGNIFTRDLFADDEQNILLSTDQGIIIFKPGQKEIGLIKNSSSDSRKEWSNHVRSIVEDEKGNLWLGTGNGIAYWDLQSGSIQPFFATENSPNRMNYPSIRGLAYDGRNLIISQSNKGVWIYDPRAKRYKRPGYQPGAAGEATRLKLETAAFINHSLTLHNGNHIISGGNGGYIIEKRSYLVTELDFPGKNNNLNFSYQDSGRRLWIGTSKGLYCLDSNLIFQFKIEGSMGDNFIRTMYETEPGKFLVGTTDLYSLQWKNGEWITQKAHPFFDAKHIVIIYKDRLGKLWLGTIDGLYRYDPANGNIETFDIPDNIQGNYYYPNSCIGHSSGLLFLGGTQGINYFYPEKVRERTEVLKTSIVKFIVNRNDSTYNNHTATARLKYFQNSIELDFVAPYFYNANGVKYRYRLHPLDTGWVDNGNSNSVRLTELQPGNYRFHVAASINGTDWFESKDQVSFVIKTPFWRTWWFILLCSAAIAIVVYAIYRYQLNKKLEVERLRLRIARDLHDDVGSALTSISILSKVALSRKNKDAEMAGYLERIKNSTAQTMESMSDIVWAINPQNDQLETIIDKMREFAVELCEPQKIQLDFFITGDLGKISFDLTGRRNLFLIFKEAVNNAVKYSGCSRLEVKFEKNVQQLQMTIRDNGKGFMVDGVRKGNGLHNIKERAKQSKGQIHIQSIPENGTLVEFRMPIPRLRGIK